MRRVGGGRGGVGRGGGANSFLLECVSFARRKENTFVKIVSPKSVFIPLNPFENQIMCFGLDLKRRQTKYSVEMPDTKLKG